MVVDMVDTVLNLDSTAPRNNETVYDSNRRLYRRLQALARELQLALLLLVPPATNTDPPTGGHGVTGSADAIWTLDRQPPSAEGAIRITGRSLREQAVPLLWDASTGRWGPRVGPGRLMLDASARLPDHIATIVGQVVGHDPVARPEIIDAVSARLKEANVDFGPAYMSRRVDEHLSTEVTARTLKRHPGRPIRYSRLR